jgi:diguanylate cyclase (GGDEF)-like protein
MTVLTNTAMLPLSLHASVPSWIHGEPLEGLIAMAADAAPRDLLLAATQQITGLLGERGSCILLDGGPRVAMAPHAPALVDWPIDLARYPEVVAACASRDLVAIENVQSDPRLETVRSLLPTELRAVAVVPLVVGSRCLGAFLVQSSSAATSAVGPEARATATLMARLTALLLARIGTDRPAISDSPGVEALRLVLPSSAPATPLVAVPGPSTAGRRVLVVEDDLSLASVLVSSLQDDGYLVDQAGDGAGGLRQAAENPPDVVLLDVNMPGLNGFETAQKLRESPATSHVPILFLSGSGDLPQRVRSVHLEDVDFLPKPFSLDELLTRLHRASNQAAAHQKLRLEAEHDELTGLANLRVLRVRLTSECARFERYGSPTTVVMVDVDKLKRINDEHGHVAGSVALRGVADVLRHEARETDLPARYGGDEFVVLLPHTTLQEGEAFAKRALAHIARLNPGGVPVTVSLGVASARTGMGTRCDEDVLRRADAAAYHAKRLGGNQMFAEALPMPSRAG